MDRSSSSGSLVSVRDLARQRRAELGKNGRGSAPDSRPSGRVRPPAPAKVEIGTENYEFETRYNRQPAVGVAISLATGANALDTANSVRAKLAEFAPFFPQGLDMVYPYDTTPFVKISIKSVIRPLKG